MAHMIMYLFIAGLKMSIEIDCPDCISMLGRLVIPVCKNPNCKDGKITVYTEAEMQEVISINTVFGKYISNSLWITSEAVEAEREEIAKMADRYNKYPDLSEAIRARS